MSIIFLAVLTVITAPKRLIEYEARSIERKIFLFREGLVVDSEKK